MTQKVYAAHHWKNMFEIIRDKTIKQTDKRDYVILLQGNNYKEITLYYCFHSQFVVIV